MSLLSNSNPTWNSTELELVRVGVDFVFQCHNKNKKKNPHLILIYRKGLQVYNLGRVTVWVSRSCLEVVWKVSRRCLEGVRKVSGKCLEGVSKGDWKVSGRWGRCLEGVWKVSGRCLEGVWKVSGRCLEGVNFLGPKFFRKSNFFRTQNLSWRKNFGYRLFRTKIFQDLNISRTLNFFGTNHFLAHRKCVGCVCWLCWACAECVCWVCSVL